MNPFTLNFVYSHLDYTFYRFRNKSHKMVQGLGVQMKDTDNAFKEVLSREDVHKQASLIAWGTHVKYDSCDEWVDYVWFSFFFGTFRLFQIFCPEMYNWTYIFPSLYMWVISNWPSLGCDLPKCGVPV